MFLEKGDKITLIITAEEVDGKQVISVLVDRLPVLNPNLLEAKKTEVEVKIEIPPVAAKPQPAEVELPIIGV